MGLAVGPSPSSPQACPHHTRSGEPRSLLGGSLRGRGQRKGLVEPQVLGGRAIPGGDPPLPSPLRPPGPSSPAPTGSLLPGPAWGWVGYTGREGARLLRRQASWGSKAIESDLGMAMPSPTQKEMKQSSSRSPGGQPPTHSHTIPCAHQKAPEHHPPPLSVSVPSPAPWHQGQRWVTSPPSGPWVSLGSAPGVSGTPARLPAAGKEPLPALGAKNMRPGLALAEGTLSTD